MPQALRDSLVSLREALLTFGPFVLLAVVLLGVAYVVLDPTPPARVVLATGPDQGAYAEFGKRYKALLAQHGIAVELRPTQGAAENLALLRDAASGVDIAFVQGGADGERRAGRAVGDSGADPDAADPRNAALVSLGSVFHEPVWLFYHTDAARRLLKTSDTLTGLTQLAGWRIGVGTPGSGVPALMATLIEANKLDAAALTLLHQPQTPAVVDLLEGRSDALVFASAPESLMVQMLLQTPGIALLDVAQAEAYSRRFPFMSPVLLPRGVVDLARDLPPADVRLIAPTATLVARRGTHPALIQLFVQAAAQIHAGAGWFQRKGEFPNPRNTELPLAREAQRFYADGAPALQRFLPFWLANLIDRMWPVLVSLLAILLPLSRALPPLYEFRIRSRIFRWYGRLREVEDDTQDRRPVAERVRELDALEARVGRIAVPLSHADELYALRGHIALVRRRLLAAPEAPA